VGHQRLPDSEVPTLNLDKKYFAGSLKLRSAGEVIAKCRDTYQVVCAKYSRLMIFVYENEGGFLTRADQEENIGKS
jgi:hypothetical protein